MLLEDDLSSVPYNVDSHSHKSDAWHPPRELADVSGPYSGRDRTTNSIPIDSSISLPIPSEGNGNFHDFTFNNTGDLTSVQVSRAEVSLFDTIQVPRIALENSGMGFDLEMGATNTGIFQEPHHSIGDEPQLRDVQQLFPENINLANSGSYPTMLDGFNDVQTILRPPNDALWSFHETSIGASSFLTRHVDRLQGLGGLIAHPHTSALNYWHTRSSSSPNVQLSDGWYSNSLLTPWRQETYADVSFPVDLSRCEVLNSRRQTRLTDFRPSSSHSAPAALKQDYLAAQDDAPSPSPSVISGPPDYPESLQCGTEDCKTTFTGRFRRGNRARHILRTHKRTVAYVCGVKSCARSYHRSDALLKHRRKKHGPS